MKKLSVYSDRGFTTPFTGDGGLANPIRFGSVVKPIDGNTEADTHPFPVWIRNDGDEKVFNIDAGFMPGAPGRGGLPGRVEYKFPEVALDDLSRLPACQARRPESFVCGVVKLDNACTAANVPKTRKHDGDDDDKGTLMPGEYFILWMRCSIRDEKLPSGHLPAAYGLKNVKLAFSTRMFGRRFIIGVALVVDTDSTGRTYYVMDKGKRVKWR